MDLQKRLDELEKRLKALEGDEPRLDVGVDTTDIARRVLADQSVQEYIADVQAMVSSLKHLNRANLPMDEVVKKLFYSPNHYRDMTMVTKSWDLVVEDALKADTSGIINAKRLYSHSPNFYSDGSVLAEQISDKAQEIAIKMVVIGLETDEYEDEELIDVAIVQIKMGI